MSRLNQLGIYYIVYIKIIAIQFIMSVEIRSWIKSEANY